MITISLKGQPSYLTTGSFKLRPCGQCREPVMHYQDGEGYVGWCHRCEDWRYA